MDKKRNEDFFWTRIQKSKKKSSCFQNFRRCNFHLCVGQVISFRGVEGEAKLAFVRSQVIAHKVRIFGDVDALQRELPQTLLSVASTLLVRRHAPRAGL